MMPITICISQVATVFGVHRRTVFHWRFRGCPLPAPRYPGAASDIDFEAVLHWYLGHVANRIYSDGGLASVEGVIRGRLKQVLQLQSQRAQAERDAYTSALGRGMNH